MPRRVRFLITPLIYLLWALLVLYPNPTLLARSIPQSLSPRIDAGAVRMWADELPDDPAYIERQVLDKYVPYAVPWQTYDVPWYFPTTREVVAEGRGDCQGRMLVLASILEAKGMPYQLRYSLDHAWVEYPRKQASTLEKPALAVMVNEGGEMRLRLPSLVQWGETLRIRRELWWDYMPLGRKLLLFVGLIALSFRRRLMRTIGGTPALFPTLLCFKRRCGPRILVRLSLSSPSERLTRNDSDEVSSTP